MRAFRPVIDHSLSMGIAVMRAKAAREA